MVCRRPEGRWANKRNEASLPAFIHQTQAEAIAVARGMIQNAGGDELITQGVDGLVRSKDTIAPGNDPCPPRDTEH